MVLVVADNGGLVMRGSGSVRCENCNKSEQS